MDRIKIQEQFAPRFGEFPELLFGTLDNARTYFDATRFLQSVNLEPEEHVEKFQTATGFWIERVCRLHAIPREEICLRHPCTQHYLFEESLSLFFLCYADPTFGFYLHESMNQMLLEGFACSDTYVLAQAGSRFTSEELITALNPETL